jgi:hypothetical protein
MTDISQDIVQIRKLINQLEILNANPDINGRQNITNQVQQIKLAVLQMEIIVANYGDY